MTQQQPVYLSVLIPAYREGERIGRTLLDIDKYLAQKQFSYEIVVYTDGSPDTTPQVVRNIATRVSHIRLIENKENHGKGYAVRTGLLACKGAWRLFMDADGSTSITHIETFLPEAEKGNDLVIGSRDLKDAVIQVHQPRYREILGDCGNLAIKSVLGLWQYPDTQCGFKLLSAKAVEKIAPRMVVDRFGFDFELLALAHYYGFKVSQLPVRWMDEQGSSVKLFGPNGYIQVLKDLFRIRLRLWMGKYR